MVLSLPYEVAKESTKAMAMSDDEYLDSLVVDVRCAASGTGTDSDAGVSLPLLFFILFRS